MVISVINFIYVPCHVIPYNFLFLNQNPLPHAVVLCTQQWGKICAKGTKMVTGA